MGGTPFPNLLFSLCDVQLILRLKEITSLTKEKTALVIPNAIQVCTDKEKHFFASFTTRDKAYSMFFKLWQSALRGGQVIRKPAADARGLLYVCCVPSLSPTIFAPADLLRKAPRM